MAKGDRGKRMSFSERHRTNVTHWTEDIDTTHPDAKIFIPVNVNGNHWILLVVDNRKKEVLSLDSLGSKRSAQRKNIMQWVEHEHIAKKADFDKEAWTSKSMNVPYQGNDSDCGPFVCLFAAFLSHDKPLDFTQADFPKKRERLNWSILNFKLQIDGRRRHSKESEIKAKAAKSKKGSSAKRSSGNAYADQLEKDGYVVLPNNVFTEPKYKKRLMAEASKFQEFSQTFRDNIRAGQRQQYVMGGFVALGNPSSFHNPIVRKFRQWAMSLVVGGVLKDLIASTGKPYNIEQFIGRMMIRVKNQNPTVEGWHRDESTIACDDDRFFGGWINLDDKDQKFSCSPRTHMKTTTSHNVFAPIDKDSTEAARHTKNKMCVTIPPGHILIFYENIVHQVLQNKTKSTLARLHLGWRLTISSGMRESVRDTIKYQGIAQIKSGQWPPMYAIFNRTNHIDGLQKWSLESMHTRCLEETQFKSGRRAGEKFRVVHRFMNSLSEYNFTLYDKYTADELKLYQPSNSWRVLKPGSENTYVRLTLS